MRRWLLLALLAALAACASVIGARTVEVPLTKLQSTVDTKFPQEQRLLGIFDLRLTRPQLALDPNGDALRIHFAFDVGQMLSRKHWQGEISLKGRLVLDTQRGVVRLAELRPTGLIVDGRGSADFAADAPWLDRIADKLGRDLTLYTFKPDELRYAGVQFKPLALRVRPDALAITFEPRS